MNERPTQYELERRWISPEGISGVSYRYSDLVRITSGTHIGETAEVIALFSIHPEPTYGVVLPPGERFAVVSQHDLEATGMNNGGTLIQRQPGEKPAGF